MKILLIQTSFLGDTVLSTPVIAALAQLFPGAEITLLTTPGGAELLARDPLISCRIVFDKNGKDSGLVGLIRMLRVIRAGRFDRVYTLHKSIRTALLVGLSGIPIRIGFREARGRLAYTRTVPRAHLQHDVLRNLAILSEDAHGHRLEEELRVYPPAASEITPTLLGITRLKESVVLFPGSVWHTKQWHWERFREFAQSLLTDGIPVVVAGGRAEVEVCERVSSGLAVINVCGLTSLSELEWLISEARAVVCNDSLALHLASAFKKPTVAIFCATIPEFGFGPWRNERARVLQRHNLSCRPCSRHGTVACPIKTEACMREVSAFDARRALEEVLRV